MEPAPIYPLDTDMVDETTRTQQFAWRVASIMLLVLTALTLVNALSNSDQGAVRLGVTVGINLLLVYGLFQGKPWARTWTLWRTALSFVAALVVTATTGLDSLLWIDALLYLTLVLVLIGKPNRKRTILGTALFVVIISGTFTLSVLDGVLQMFNATTTMNNQVDLAFEKLDQEDPEAAVQILEEVIREDPEILDAHIGLGLAYFVLDRPDESLAAFDRAIELNPNETTAWDYRGQIFYELERYEQAVSDFDQAISLEPDTAFYHRAKADALLSLEQFDEALKSASKAIELDETDPMNYVIRAWIYVGLEDQANAETDFREAIQKLPPDDPGVAQIEGIIEAMFPATKQVK